MNDGVRKGLSTAPYKIPYRTSEKPGLEGEVEDFMAQHSREHAKTLAQKLTLAVQNSSDGDDALRRSCKDFLTFCFTTLNYGRELDEKEKREAKVSPAQALQELEQALKEKFPVRNVQTDVRRSFEETANFKK